jgi:hypothetical protein
VQALKALVILMAILIAVGAGLVAVTLYKRATVTMEAHVGTTEAAADKNAAAQAHGFGTQHIAIPEGAHLDDVIASGNRMILKLRLADGSPHLIVVDLETGANFGEIDLAPAP